MPTCSRIGHRCWPNASHASWDSQTSTTRNPLGLSPAEWKGCPRLVSPTLTPTYPCPRASGRWPVVLRGDRRTVVDQYDRHCELLVRVGRPCPARRLAAGDYVVGTLAIPLAAQRRWSGSADMLMALLLRVDEQHTRRALLLVVRSGHPDPATGTLATTRNQQRTRSQPARGGRQSLPSTLTTRRGQVTVRGLLAGAGEERARRTGQRKPPRVRYVQDCVDGAQRRA
jgi:hypothetical protein